MTIILIRFYYPTTLSISCIIGLGNPGEDYIETRHNIGFMVIDELARRRKCKIKPGKGSFYIGRMNMGPGRGNALLVKPTTYMNRSGIAVKQVLDNEELTSGDILIIVDDFELPFGQIRIRKTGSAGSHNGLNSVIERIETEDFPRLRIGIGTPPANLDPAEYVLSPFSRAEREELEDIIARAADAAETAVLENIDIAMNIYNAKNE